ncbi:MAG TPA: M20/M25/M40 family metallo-hydrolase [Planctomycetota bacterium]|nr:M20/M25/M40 family metallo-hydrolase [Planctomycetota bacterium]
MTGPPEPALLPVEWLLDRTAALCAHDTTTGGEDHGLPALRALLAELDARVETFVVAPGRSNVLATWGSTVRLLFSTHLDTVPPWFGPRQERGLLHARGACDAKGQVVAQLATIRSLLAAGITDLGWLGVVGEETDSVGARSAVALAGRFTACRALIGGEPTENRLATGQRGAQQLQLRVQGVAAHSGTPERGRSAIWPLLEWLERLRALPTAHDAELGDEIWNLGLLRGGEAPNVVPPHAEAQLFVRALPGSDFVARAQALAPPHGTLEVVSATPADHFPRLPGFDRGVVPFGSDVPRLRELVPGRTAALVGPGSITVAHTAEERITAAELQAGQHLLLRLARTLLA